MTPENQNCKHEETDIILDSGKARYHSVQKLLSTVRNEGVRETIC